MAARRFGGTTTRRFSSRSPFRARRPLRKVLGPQRWERGNIFITNSHTHTTETGDDLLTVFRLADACLWGDASTDISRAMMETVRSVEIGGIVGAWHTNMDVIDIVDPVPIDKIDSYMHVRNLIVGDRVTADTPGIPQPAAVSCNWFTNTTPISTTHEDQDEQYLYPTRIFHQDSIRLCPTVLLADGPGVGTNLDAFPRLQTVQSGRHAFNRKFRIRLEDDQGLYWHSASHVSNTAEVLAAELSFDTTLLGTIFYRVRF